MRKRKLQTRIKKLTFVSFSIRYLTRCFARLGFFSFRSQLFRISDRLFFSYLFYCFFFKKKSILRRSSSRSRRFKKGASRSENATAQHLARRLGALESRDPHRVPHYQCFYSCGTKTTAPHSRHRLIEDSYKSWK